MSYDLHLAPPETDQPEAIQLAFADWPAMPDPLAQQRNERLIAELLAANPDFSLFSRFSENVGGRYYELSLNNGTQISLYPNSGGVTLPYWYRDRHLAEAIFREIQQYIEVIQTIAHYAVYDVQLEPEEIDFAASFERILSTYLYGVEMTRSLLPKP